MRDGECSEAARDLLLHLDHADVLLALVICEGDIGGEQKCLHAQVVVIQTADVGAAGVLLIDLVPPR